MLYDQKPNAYRLPTSVPAGSALPNKLAFAAPTPGEEYGRFSLYRRVVRVVKEGEVTLVEFVNRRGEKCCESVVQFNRFLFRHRLMPPATA